MKIMIVGLGSMGKRRLRLVREIIPDVQFIGIDGRQDRREEAERLYGIETFRSLADGINEKPEIAFVSTSPLSHYAIIKECLKNGISIFSEINLVNENHKELIALAAEKGCTLFLSSTPLYRREMRFTAQAVKDFGKSVNYTYHVGQYLPDWHPWEKFTDFFVGDKRTNGCREIFAIELPWIIDAFGEISEFTVCSSKVSNLKIDFNDSYMVTTEHSNGNRGSICFDVVSRPPVRRLDVFGDHFKIDWNGTPDSFYAYNDVIEKQEKISLYDNVEQNANYNSSIIENMYLEEIENFLQVYKKEAAARYSFEKDIEVLELIDRIEGIK